GQIMRYFHPRAMLPDLLAAIDDWKPHVIVVDPSEWGGVLAAELNQIPYAVVAIGLVSGTAAVGGAVFPALSPADPGQRRAWAAVLGGRHSMRALREELGLAPAPQPWEDQALNRRFLTLDTAPPSFHFYLPEAASRTAHPMRPVPYSLPPAHSSPRWEQELDKDRPTIHITLGTVRSEVGLLGTIVEGVMGARANVVVSLGRAVDEAALRSFPPHVRVEPWIDYVDLMPHCDLVVTHGGAGTTLAALAHGVPQLVIPGGADQPVNAARVRSVGAGRFLAGDHVAPEAVGAEVEVLLRDPVYRLNALRMRAEIDAMPPPADAVRLLERLAGERRPLYAPFPLSPELRAARMPTISDPAETTPWGGRN
ncbi:MAG: hypothetical protein LC792_01260, partial [Actinobacteria bacterium]|nr:hypothetical protein [Actinomycetota bacterium]